MPNAIAVEVQELRNIAKALRDNAKSATLPGYAEKLIEAARQLEQRALELEGSIYIQGKDRRSP